MANKGLLVIQQMGDGLRNLVRKSIGSTVGDPVNATTEQESSNNNPLHLLPNIEWRKLMERPQ